MNLSDNFNLSTTFTNTDKPEKKREVENRLFKLNDFLEGASKKNRNFAFNSEHTRNFDQENINKAKQGVKELIADAIAKAKSQAIEIKDQALKEGKNTGHAEGFQQGFEEGKNKAKEEFDPLLKTLNDLILELSELRKVMYPKVENEMVGMIVDLTKKVLHRDMNLREDSVKEMILLAMNSVVNKENMVIRIHPSDKKHIENFRPELQSLFSEIKNINFEEHSGIKRGGCIIETNFGTVNAEIDQLDEQIEKILNFTPTVPETNPTSTALADNTLETGTDEISEPASEDAESKIETKKNVMTPTDATPKGEAEELVTSETPTIIPPAPEKEPEEPSEKPEDTADFKEED